MCFSISSLRSSAPERAACSSSASGGPSVRKYDSAEARSNPVRATVAPLAPSSPSSVRNRKFGEVSMAISSWRVAAVASPLVRARLY